LKRSRKEFYQNLCSGSKDISGLYIHVPYCIKRCRYCTFFSKNLTKEKELENFIRLLKKEISLYTFKISPKTIYIGGGSPAILNFTHLKELINTLKSKINFKKIKEFTIEANPQNIIKNKQNLNLLLKLGINRISLGAQSFINSELKILGRSHSKEQIIESINYLKANGFKNINIDLIYGIPGQTLKTFHESLKHAVQLLPSGISLYSLELKNRTFINFIKKNRLKLVPEHLQRKMYYVAQNFLNENKYIQYEISNFAKKHAFSKHNLNYWNYGDYIGIGPSAVSKVDSYRYKITTNMKKYQQFIEAELIPYENLEFLDLYTKIFEFIMLGLRKTSGIIFENYYKLTGRNFLKDFERIISFLKNLGMIGFNSKKIYLLPEAYFVINEVILYFIRELDLLNLDNLTGN